MGERMAAPSYSDTMPGSRATAMGRRTTKLAPRCEAQARMLAERLAFGANAVEAAEDMLALWLGNAGPFILDADQHLIVGDGGDDAHQALVGREGHGIVDEIVEHADQPPFLAQHDRDALARAREGEADAARHAADLARDHHLFDEEAKVDRLEPGAGQLGVDARGFGDVGDQPVEPAHIVLRDGHQLRAQVRPVHPFQRIERGAQRGDGVFQLMADIGGEGVGRVDALAQRMAHVGQGAGQHADLVAPFGQARHRDFARAAQAHAHRCAGQALERLDDGAGEEEREQHRRQHRRAQHQAEAEAFGAHGAGDVARVFGGEQAGSVLHRHGRGDHEGAVGGIAVHRPRPAGAARGLHFGPGGGAIERRLLEIGRAVGRHDAVDQLVKEAGDMALPFLFGRQAQAVARRVHGEAVRDQRAVRAIAAHPVAGLARIGGDQLVLPIGRRIFQADRQQFQLARRLAQPVVHDAGAIAVEIEEAAGQQRQREYIDRQDARGEAQPPRPAHRNGHALIPRRIGSRRHRGCRSH